MNLHELKFNRGAAAVPGDLRGVRGRYLGRHLWRVEEGTPPELRPYTGSIWNRQYWNPPRYSWQPYISSLNVIRDENYVSPLCGSRTSSRTPFVTPAYGSNTCESCARAAQTHALDIVTPEVAETMESRIAVRDERMAWTQAGRPDVWPPQN